MAKSMLRPRLVLTFCGCVHVEGLVRSPPLLRFALHSQQLVTPRMARRLWYNLRSINLQCLRQPCALSHNEGPLMSIHGVPFTILHEQRERC
jgi:hypothetical protein